VGLAVEPGDGGRVCLLGGDGSVVAEAVPSTLAVDVPPPPSRAAVERAAAASGRHAPDADFPTCFGCGAARAEGDGLRVFAGPVEGRDLVAAPWTPDPSLESHGGEVAEEFVWAALDCPAFGAWERSRPKLPALLGRISATVVRPVRVGDPTAIIAWPLAADGRKLYSASALFAADGSLSAYAATTWIVLR